MKITIRLLAIVFLTYMHTSIFAQTRTEKCSYSGTIVSENGQPLAGATIYIPDLKRGTVSLQDGTFSLQNIPAGNYLVEIRYVGYQTIAQNVEFEGDEHGDFVMEVAVTEENEIVITGTSRATSIKRNPAPIVSISKEYLQQTLSTNIINAISKVPGISEVTTGPNVSKPFIRGLGFNRILTLYDGVRQEGQQWGNEHGVEIDKHTVGKVEVIKGPASLTYGSDAVAGVINFLPPKTPHEGEIKGHLINEYQTNNRMIENSGTLEGHTGDVTWGSTISHKLATNYKNKYDGRVYNTGFREMDASVHAGLHKSWGFSKLGLTLYDDLQEIPDGSRDSATRRFTKQISDEDDFRPIVSSKELNSYSISELHQHVQHLNIYTNNRFIVGRGRLGINLGYQRSLRQEFAHPESNIPALDLLLNTYTYDAKYFLHPGKGWDLSAGINGMYQENKVEKGTEFIIPPFQQLDFGPFIFVKKALNKLELAGGLRFDVRNFRNGDLYVIDDPDTDWEQVVTGKDTAGAERLFTAEHKNFSGWSAAWGFTYLFNKQWSVKVNVGRGYRAPSITEIAAQGIHHGDQIYQLGNPNTKPESNWQEDLGITYNSTHVTINLSLFNNDIAHYIFNQKLQSVQGGDSIIIPGIETFKYVSAQANLKGGELSIDIHPHPLDWLHFENSISVVYGTNKGENGKGAPEGAEYLPFIPPLHTLSELRANFNLSPRLQNTFLKLQYAWYAPQNRAFTYQDTETSTPGYGLVQAGAGTDITNRNGKTVLNLALMADNIFNVAYQSHLNRLKYFEEYPGNFTGRDGIYNMGANISFRVTIPFDL